MRQQLSWVGPLGACLTSRWLAGSPALMAQTYYVETSPATPKDGDTVRLDFFGSRTGYGYVASAGGGVVVEIEDISKESPQIRLSQLQV